LEERDRVKELKTYCRDHGVPLTQQRLEIFRTLLGSPDHPSPEEIHIRLKGEFPTLSLATVYKNLEALSKIGFALEPHSNFVCLSCKMVEDIHDSALLDFDIPDPDESEHEITAKTIQYYGICKQCKDNT
jgi:Fur family peroxide stress response transcriptional regulator